MEYTIQDALKSLAETGNCPVPPPIMGKLIEVGYFEATINGMTSKEFYEKWLKENEANQEDEMNTAKELIEINFLQGVTDDIERLQDDIENFAARGVEWDAGEIVQHLLKAWSSADLAKRELRMK